MKTKQQVDLKCGAYVEASSDASVLLGNDINTIYLDEEAFSILFDFVRKELKWKV